MSPTHRNQIKKQQKNISVLSESDPLLFIYLLFRSEKYKQSFFIYD